MPADGTSGRTTRRRPTHPGVGCSMTVQTATGRPASTSAATSPSSGNVRADTFSTKTSRIPPQVSPTAKASSSLMPYRWSTGSPEETTSCDSSYTAPSTHPPDTLPTASPSGPTSIDAPAGRGAERQVATTVATPTGRPERHQPSSSPSTSRTGHHLHDLGERRQRVPGDEVVHVGQRGDDAALHRTVPRLAPVRVHPDHTMRKPVQPRHLLGQQTGPAPLPPVAEEDDDGTARRAARPPAVEERLEYLAQPGAARPVGDLLPRVPQRDLRVPATQRRGDPRQPGADGEDLGGAGRAADQDVREPQQRVGIGGHRT